MLKLLLARSEQEKEVGTQLKRQLETAQDHLNDVLSAKETDLNRRVARKLDERDSAEREAYETKLAKMLSQLKALELVLGGKSYMVIHILTPSHLRCRWRLWFYGTCVKKICFVLLPW